MLGYTNLSASLSCQASRSDPTNASSQSRSIPAATPQHSPGDQHVSADSLDPCAPPSVGDAPVDDALTKPKQTIFVCQQCHSSFLTSTGLEKHTQSHDPDAAPAESELTRASKMPRVDTVQATLNRRPADIPTPPKTFLCPLCQTSIGRKGLAGHLRNVHQVDKPEFFSFRPSRDMMPGRLGCAHCLSCFATEACLETAHYHRATCPALLIEWVKDMHFGPAAMPEPSQGSLPESAMPSVALEQPKPFIVEPALVMNTVLQDTRFGLCGLQMPFDTPDWHSTLTHDLCARLVDGQSCVDVPMTLSFGPEYRLSWYGSLHSSVQVQIEDAIPPASSMYTHAQPIYWAWTSDELVTIQPDRVPVHDTLDLQHHLFQTCLFELEHVLAQDWYHWCLHQGLQDGPYERRGSIFLRSDGGVFRTLQTAATQRGGTIIRSDALPIRTEEILALIGFGIGRRIDTPGYAGHDLEARGPIEPIEPRPHVPFVYSGRQELQTSKTWHGQREQGKVDRPLRQLMFQSVFEELASRAAQLPLGSN